MAAVRGKSVEKLKGQKQNQENSCGKTVGKLLTGCGQISLVFKNLLTN